MRTIINYQRDEITELWKKYNESSQKLAKALGRTNNIVGEYAEYLALQYLGGELLEISNTSADIRANNGTLYQVKCRKVKNNFTTQLNVIRSWEFDFLFVILFNKNGAVEKALVSPVFVAQEYGKENNYLNGCVITTTYNFLSDSRNQDITCDIKKLQTAYLPLEDVRNDAF